MIFNSLTLKTIPSTHSALTQHSWEERGQNLKNKGDPKVWGIFLLRETKFTFRKKEYLKAYSAVSQRFPLKLRWVPSLPFFSTRSSMIYFRRQSFKGERDTLAVNKPLPNLLQKVKLLEISWPTGSAKPISHGLVRHISADVIINLKIAP